jgi:Ca-activated chloride channel family protein
MNLLGYDFLYPYLLFGWLLIPLLAVYHYLWKVKKYPTFQIGGLEGIPSHHNTWRTYLNKSLPAFRWLAIGLFFTALARPQTSSSGQNISTEGIDIVLSVDVSTSMLAMDFKPNRLGASKSTAIKFIDERPNDRIGLVIFSGESFTVCPATTDHNILKNQVSDVQSGILEDGTAIGMGLATAVDRLRTSDAKSKVVILLTDGVNNAGLIDPQTATDIAMRYNIRVYCIGVGTYGMALYPTPNGAQQMPVEIDEVLMKQISNATGGKYFRATNNKVLTNIFSEIDKMEKTKIEINSFQQKAEQFYIFALLGLALLLFETILRYFILKINPI